MSTIPAFSMTGFDFLFAVAFLLGFITIPLLARIREEGETDTETLLDELRTQTRENLRALNSVRGMSYVAQFPDRGHALRASGVGIRHCVRGYGV